MLLVVYIYIFIFVLPTGYSPEQQRSQDSTTHSLRQSRSCLVLISKYFGTHQQPVVCFHEACAQAQLRPTSLVLVTWGELTKQTLECGVRTFLGHSQHLPITAHFFWDRLLYLLPPPLRPRALGSNPDWLRLSRRRWSLKDAMKYRSSDDVHEDNKKEENTQNV